MATEHTFVWEGRSIRLSYEPRWSASIDHVEIEALDEQPLPITGTGYRSHFFSPVEPMTIEEVTAMVVAWLDEEAKSKAWRDFIEQFRQLSLF
ncbi:hypothetical protein GC173_02960 [bacterium]|nr:hypothetical protein [bacterium]